MLPVAASRITGGAAKASAGAGRGVSIQGSDDAAGAPRVPVCRSGGLPRLAARGGGDEWIKGAEAPAQGSSAPPRRPPAPSRLLGRLGSP